MRYLCLLFALSVYSCKDADKKTTGKDWVITPFIKIDSANPVLLPDSTSVFNCPVLNKVIRWEAKDVFNPAATIRHDTLFLLYRAEDKIGKYAGTSRIGIAYSLDGLHFIKNPAPVLYPGNDEQKKYEWEGGCEDPRITEDEKGTYYLTYTAYDGDKARLMIATSSDLYHWTKHGLAFANNKTYDTIWSKSGSIVSEYKNGRPVAVKINGKYRMYWGDTEIFYATSDDLIHWQPAQNVNGKSVAVFGPRKGKFDSDLVEPGPAAMLTDKGIVLIYNCRNVPSKGDTSLAEGTYAPSQILLSATEPDKVVDRMDTYFMKPDKPYEINGQVGHVCFAEGLVQYKGKWFLYYGTADSKIAVAIKD
ncbi:MAG: glycosidase [Sphingobacteriales bacterium]|nr:MAG: glycosidase [Sphingobacteriales bacterium]